MARACRCVVHGSVAFCNPHLFISTRLERLFWIEYNTRNDNHVLLYLVFFSFGCHVCLSV